MLRVVLIEDEVLILMALAIVMADWGYDTVAAYSEDDAVAKLAGGPAPELLITDWRLREGLTGGQAIARIRAMYQKGIPAIVMTGETDPERLREIGRLGCPVLHKPVQTAELRAVMNAVVAA